MKDSHRQFGTSRSKRTTATGAAGVCVSCEVQPTPIRCVLCLGLARAEERAAMLIGVILDIEHELVSAVDYGHVTNRICGMINDALGPAPRPYLPRKFGEPATLGPSEDGT